MRFERLDSWGFWDVVDGRVSAIYCLRNIVNDKLYVGSTKDLNTRARWHRRSLDAGRHHSVKLQRAWSKYGPKSFMFEIIERVPVDDLEDSENFWLGELDVVRNGYNHCPFAESPRGVTRSEETKKKISIAMRGRKTGPPSPEHRRKISIATTGVPKGPMPEWRKRQISAHQRGRKKPPGFGKKIAEANRKRVVSDETRRKMSEAAKRRCATYKRGAEGRFEVKS